MEDAAILYLDDSDIYNTINKNIKPVWNYCTYRADVESLVDISKLALTYAASQLDTIPLNLIIPC